MERLLVVVDYQKDFVAGALGFPQAATLESGISRLVESSLERGDRVIFTLDTHREESYLESREGRALPVPHCYRGSDGWRLYGSLGAYMTDSRVTLLEKGSFGSAGYAELLPQPPEEITLVGVVTNMCVISNAVTLQTLYPDARITIVSGLCASFDPDLHSKALDVMRSLQMEIV